MILERLPEITDEDHQDCWLLAQEQTARKSEKALGERTPEEAVEHTYRGLCCERAYFRSISEDMYLECIARQEVTHAAYGSDAGEVDVKSSDMKYGPNHDYNLYVTPANLEKDNETQKYVLVIRQFVRNKGFIFWYAGWASKEEMKATTDRFYGKPCIKRSKLHA